MDEQFIGILSGTSLDAIDVGIFRFNNTIETICTYEHKLSNYVKEHCQRLVHDHSTTTDATGKLNSAIAKDFASAINTILDTNNIKYNEIKAVGSHGININHNPSGDFPFSMQLGDPSTIAALTGIPVAADFRAMDVAFSGQGAPLAPLFHEQLFSNTNKNVVIVNIGGISNITVLAKNSGTIGFDVGPGNCLINELTQKLYSKEYDKDSNIAYSGTVNTDALEALLNDEYFAKSYPKSTGREYFNMKWLENKLAKYNLENQDLIATVTALTAKGIHKGITQTSLDGYEIFVCGGGVHNKFIIEKLTEYSGTKVASTSELGLDPNFVEAGLFAWLAKARVNEERLDYQRITGSTKPITLGGLWLP